ncbi:hypothetical protein TNIN_96741 [Trichonephila inaurata madagascariensis]|uniref:Uncharacterized protein n=1 Tax=Trichonephila inaurata madagascariensis TaxID=2747483 RepID=A0A8X6IL06_9ARAC|nr:hypothetical protein TNIN_96741 [Trichonephila inaurata madagascariensis]
MIVALWYPIICQNMTLSLSSCPSKLSIHIYEVRGSRAVMFVHSSLDSIRGQHPSAFSKFVPSSSGALIGRPPFAPQREAYRINPSLLSGVPPNDSHTPRATGAPSPGELESSFCGQAIKESATELKRDSPLLGGGICGGKDAHAQ